MALVDLAFDERSSLLRAAVDSNYLPPRYFALSAVLQEWEPRA